MSALTPSPLPLAPLLEEAREHCTRLLLAEENVRDGLHALCVATWHFGRTLAAIKESGVARHGNWMFFVAANFPELGKVTPLPTDKSPSEAQARAEATRVRNANLAKAFFEANPNWTDSSNFTEESIRKSIFRLAPEKERPQLTGNKKISPEAHPLSFVNKYEEWRRRVTVGLITAPRVETLRKDFEPVLRDIIERCGRDYIIGLLATP